MAFRRKDIKKSSYYVWFLGAKEASGLRGEEFVIPVMHQLLDRERDQRSEPHKVTLQISVKGMKIIQTVPKSKGLSSPSGGNASPALMHPQFPHHASMGPSPASNCKMEQIKHLIPVESITSVVQQEDIVSALLLIYNPITQCPVHVHGYRCDSIETASALYEQLSVLSASPENLKRVRELELKYHMKAYHPPGSSHSGNRGHHHMMGPQVPSRKSDRDAREKHLSPSPFRSIGSASSDGRSTRTEGSDDSSVSSPSSDPRRHMNPLHFMRKEPAPSPSSHHHHVHPPPIHPHHMSQNPQSHLKKVIPSSKHPMQRETEKHVSSIEDPSNTVFDSVAHELKVKLNAKVPILLPPRDYDTISRSRGNIKDVEHHPVISGRSSSERINRERNSSEKASRERLSNIQEARPSRSPPRVCLGVWGEKATPVKNVSTSPATNGKPVSSTSTPLASTAMFKSTHQTSSKPLSASSSSASKKMPQVTSHKVSSSSASSPSSNPRMFKSSGYSSITGRSDSSGKSGSSGIGSDEALAEMELNGGGSSPESMPHAMSQNQVSAPNLRHLNLHLHRPAMLIEEEMNKRRSGHLRKSQYMDSEDDDHSPSPPQEENDSHHSHQRNNRSNRMHDEDIERLWLGVSDLHIKEELSDHRSPSPPMDKYSRKPIPNFLPPTKQITSSSSSSSPRTKMNHHVVPASKMTTSSTPSSSSSSKLKEVITSPSRKGQAPQPDSSKPKACYYFGEQ